MDQDISIDEKMDEANRLWAKERGLEAINLLRPLLDSFDRVRVQSNLGLIMVYYRTNEEIPYFSEGLKMLEDASEAGDPSATHNLGTLYVGGHLGYLEDDRKQAAYYYLKSRDQALEKGLRLIASPEFYNGWSECLE